MPSAQYAARIVREYFPSAQVQLSFEQGRDNAVEAVSGLASPGSYPLPSRNYRILGLISDAGCGAHGRWGSTQRSFR